MAARWPSTPCSTRSKGTSASSDRRRGDRTLALMLATRASLAVAIASIVLAFALFSWAAALLWVRAWLLLVPLTLWLAVLVPWYRRRDTVSTALQQRGMYHALGVWAITDLAILLVFA